MVSYTHCLLLLLFREKEGTKEEWKVNEICGRDVTPVINSCHSLQACGFFVVEDILSLSPVGSGLYESARIYLGIPNRNTKIEDSFSTALNQCFPFRIQNISSSVQPSGNPLGVEIHRYSYTYHCSNTPFRIWCSRSSQLVLNIEYPGECINE